MRLGIAHHLGWAVAVTASSNHEVVDRRRIALIEPGMATAPIHHEGKPLDDDATAALVAQVRASTVRATSASLDQLAPNCPNRSCRCRCGLAARVPRRHRRSTSPYESNADSIMYRQVLAEQARTYWDVHLYSTKDVENRRSANWPSRRGSCSVRATIGPPWTKRPSDGARRLSWQLKEERRLGPRHPVSSRITLATRRRRPWH
jgi:hypothetical protein